MTKKIDSDALEIVNKSLGLTGAGSPVTELQDGVVDQILDVGPAARRGRSIAPSDGIFTGLIQNGHLAGDERTTQLDVYEVGTVVSIPPYPAIVPVQFDIWLLYATVRRSTGAATVDAALFYQMPSANQGWGVDNAGAQVVESAPMALAFWDTLQVLNTTFGLMGTLGPMAKIGIRLPRGNPVNGSLRFVSSTSAAATIQCQMVFGIFPVSLGQDGLV